MLRTFSIALVLGTMILQGAAFAQGLPLPQAPPLIMPPPAPPPAPVPSVVTPAPPLSGVTLPSVTPNYAPSNSPIIGTVRSSEGRSIKRCGKRGKCRTVRRR